MKMNFIFIFIFCSSSNVFCEELGPTLQIPSAKVLPKGIRSFQIIGFTSSLGSRWNSTGKVEPFGNLFNQKINWNKIIKNQNDLHDRTGLKAYLKENHYDLDENIGETTGVLDISLTVNAPVFAYGITDSWTVAVVLPIVSTKYHFESGFIAYPEGQRLADQFRSKGEGKINKSREMETKLSDPVALQAQEKNYEIRRYFSKDEIGDLRVINKYLFKNHSQYSLAFQQGITIPSGRTQNIYQLIDVAPGDGQWDLSFGTIAEYHFPYRIHLLAEAHYTYQMYDHIAKRVPESSKDLLTSDIDPSVRRDLGDYWSLTLGTKWNVNDEFDFFSSLSYQKKWNDRFSGSYFPLNRYTILSEGTEQDLTSCQLGIGYSTVSLFLKKEFVMPFESKLSYSFPLKGHQVAYGGRGIWEFLMFF